MIGLSLNFRVQNMFHVRGYWILGFETGIPQNLPYFVVLQCIKVQLSVRFEQLELLPTEYSLSVRVLQLDPGILKSAKFIFFFQDSCLALAQWMNRYLVGEIRVVPTKGEHILTLGATMET